MQNIYCCKKLIYVAQLECISKLFSGRTIRTMATITSFFAKVDGPLPIRCKEPVELPKKRCKRVPGSPRKAQSSAVVVVDSGDEALTLRLTATAHAWYSYACMLVIKFLMTQQ